ncbi:EamA family transporter [Rhizobium sp. CFBP 8762]|nr:EamA family transporter [Rhizobium sp. CFBP 8762]MBD8553767.1 EamA family transporter [Rhizobium sp. CFBP 8762]
MVEKTPSTWTSSKFAPLGAVGVAMLSITIGASIAKQLFPVIGPAGTTTLRLALAALILVFVFRLWKFNFRTSALISAIPYGMSLGLMNLLFYMAIQRIPLGVALAIEFTGPLTVALAYSRRRSDLFWVALTLLGLSFLLPLHQDYSTIDLRGVGYAFAAGICWGIYIVSGKRAGSVLGAQAPALGMILAAVVVLPFGLVEAGTVLLRFDVLTLALLVAVLSSAIPYSLEMFALQRLPAKSFGVLTSGEPAMGAIVGMVVLGEVLSLTEMAGIAAIVIASVGVIQSAR